MAISVLVVEDDKNIRDLLQMYLEKEGYAVTAAADGGEALVKFRSIKPDLGLLDVMMPVMDGWAVCRAIRARAEVTGVMHRDKLDARHQAPRQITAVLVVRFLVIGIVDLQLLVIQQAAHASENIGIIAGRTGADRKVISNEHVALMRIQNQAQSLAHLGS